MTTTSRPSIDYEALVKDDRVHGRVYLDPDIFEDEFERIFHRGWVYVGHASEIPEPGDYRLTSIGRQSVIMSRGEDGQIHLLMNRCTHRANAVCNMDRGNATFFRCQYHGWTFKNDGDLVGVTYDTGYDQSFRKEDFGLRKAPRMASYRGFVWGSLSPTGISIDEHLTDAAKRQLDLFCDLSPMGEIDARAGVHKYGYNANWKFQMENSIDGYHVNFTHQSFFAVTEKRMGRRLNMFTGDSVSVTRDLGNGHAMLDNRPYNRAMRESGEAPPNPMMATPWGQEYLKSLVQAHGMERTQELLTAGGTHMNIFPNLVVLGVQIRMIRPVAVDRTEVFLYPALLKGVPDELNAMRLRGHETFYGPGGGGATDDLEMFVRNQTGLSAQVDPWLVLTRGQHREHRDADGTLTGQITDEVPQRAQWRRWKQEMTAG